MKFFTEKLKSIIIPVFLMMFSMSVVFAQDDMMGEDNNAAMSNEDCKPKSFDTSYMKFQSDTISQRQVEIWFSFAQEDFKHKEYRKAIPYYWKVMLNDKSGRYGKFTYSKLADCYSEMGKTAENSRAYLDSTLLVVYKGLEKFPKNERLHYRAGSLHRRLSQNICAIPHYEALVEKHPESASYLKILAKLLFGAEDERCIEVQQRLVKVDPAVENNNLLRQMLEFFDKDPMQAVVGAFEQDTTNVVSALALGKEALINGNYKLALRAFNAAWLVEPQNLDGLDGKAKSLEGLGRMSEALKTYKQIVNFYPSNIGALSNLAYTYASLKNFSAARSYAYKARKVDPNKGASYMVMARILEEAVEYCSGKRDKNEYTYDDKLVFEKAGAEYAKAKRDPNYVTQADSRIRALRPFYRTKEEKFLKNNRKNIKDTCYNWLK